MIGVAFKCNAVAAQMAVVKKRWGGKLIRLTKKWMNILRKARLGCPVFKSDADFIGGFAFRHPLRFLHTNGIHKTFEWRRGAFANTYDADIRRFNQGDIKTLEELS